MSPNPRFDEICAQMDALLSAFLDGEASFEDTRTQLAGVLRHIVRGSRSTGRAPVTITTCEFHVPQRHDLMKGRSAEEITRGTEVLRAALFGTPEEIGDGTA